MERIKIQTQKNCSNLILSQKNLGAVENNESDVA